MPRELPWVTSARTARLGGSPRLAITSVFCGVDAGWAAPDPVCPGLAPGAHPTTARASKRANGAVTLMPGTDHLGTEVITGLALTRASSAASTSALRPASSMRRLAAPKPIGRGGTVETVDERNDTHDGQAPWQDFVHAGPGTLAGRYLRMFWQPVFRSADLKRGSAVPIQVMNEELTLYRGESGAA